VCGIEWNGFQKIARLIEVIDRNLAQARSFVRGEDAQVIVSAASMQGPAVTYFIVAPPPTMMN